MARELAASGIELYEQGAYPEASAQLEHAYKFVKVPTTGLWSARALDKVGELLGAAERYQEVLVMPVQPGEPGVFAEARLSARQELDFLNARIPSIVVRVTGTAEGVSVTIDDVALEQGQIGKPVQVNPGDRRVLGTLGDRVERVTLSLPERATGSAVLDFSPLAKAAPEPAPAPVEKAVDSEGIDRETWGYIALSAGGAALITGLVATSIASSQESDLEQTCPASRCAPAFHDDVDSLNTTLSVSFVGYLGAAIGLGAGSYLLLTASNEEAAKPAPSVAVWFGPASGGFSGRF